MEEFDISKIDLNDPFILNDILGGYYWGDLTNEQLEQRKSNWNMKDINGNPISFGDYFNSKGNRKVLMDPQGNPASPTKIQEVWAKYKNPDFKDRNHVDANSNEKIKQWQAEQWLTEFNRQADHFFTGGPFSPNVIAGALGRAAERAFTGDNAFFGGRGDFFHDWLLGNNGTVTDNFARKHPNLATGLNLAFDFLPGMYNIAHSISPTAIEKATGKVMSYIKHPTWKTYYHGSSYPFDIRDFFRGTPQDYGLHMGDKNIATELSQNASAFQNYGINLGYSYKPTVYKFRAPRPSASTIDTHANDFRHLSENLLIKGGEGVRYDLHPGDKFTWNTFKNSGTTLNYFPNSDTYPFTTLSNDIRINMRKFFPKIKNNPEFNKRAQDIIDEATKMKKEGITSPMLEDLNSRIDLNTRTAELLSDAGYPVIKYENLAFGEVPEKFIRSNKPYYSYILTDPSKIDLMEPHKLKAWHPLPYINKSKNQNNQ